MTIHPLEPLTADEIARAVEILRAKEDRVEESMLDRTCRARRTDEGRARGDSRRTARRDHGRARTGR